MAIWLDGWTRTVLGSNVRGKNYQYKENPKGCIHTTEGTSIAGAIGAYSPYPPHGIYNPLTREKVQHIPLDLASYSAMDGNDDDYMVQIEIVGFAADSRGWNDTILRNIAEDVVGPISKAFGIPLEGIDGWYDGRDGVSPPLASPGSPIRLSPAELRDFSGWLGHQHLPAPDKHWDPGHLNFNRILSFIGDDDMQLTDRMKNAWGGTPTMEEVFRYIDLRSTEASEGVAKANDKLDALAAKVGTGGIDIKALAAELAVLLPEKKYDEKALVAILNRTVLRTVPDNSTNPGNGQ